MIQPFTRAAVAAAIAVAAVAALPAAAMDNMMTGGHQVTIPLAAQNGSGESGKAMLKDSKAGLVVTVSLTGAPATAQPAHIHKGTCAKLDPKPQYPLKSVVGGTSTTTIPGLTLANVMMSPHAVNVHKSPTQIATYVACGNIKAAHGGAMK